MSIVMIAALWCGSCVTLRGGFLHIYTASVVGLESSIPGSRTRVAHAEGALGSGPTDFDVDLPHYSYLPTLAFHRSLWFLPFCRAPAWFRVVRCVTCSHLGHLGSSLLGAFYSTIPCFPRGASTDRHPLVSRPPSIALSQSPLLRLTCSSGIGLTAHRWVSNSS